MISSPRLIILGPGDKETDRQVFITYSRDIFAQEIQSLSKKQTKELSKLKKNNKHGSEKDYLLTDSISLRLSS